jgi:predicted  nucleic acid-binding Zn-ribbon protein
MAKIKVTPDAALATVEAVKIRLEQLRKEIEGTHDSNEIAHLNRRIKALKDRLAVGEKPRPVDPKLLLSKNDLL